ncbi:MAG: C69 family dipeptidase [Bacteroidales bacterium]|nr:C69 family dipeptidase [Bacteroidales bacterium]
MNAIRILLSIALSQMAATVFPCTNIIVTKGASTDGSVMITYAADSHIRYGELYFRQGGKHAPGAKVKLYDRGTAKFLGEVPQVSETFTTIGFMNELQVAIGETTFGGREELIDTTGIVDYGSLMFLSMQRSKTAREAISWIARLVEEYGYYSSGETFSISDPNEAWIMEIVGKGMDLFIDQNGKMSNRNKGAVWVAIRIPDGYVSAHANHARITIFRASDGKRSISSLEMEKLSNPDVEVIYSHDVISFAQKQGYFKGPESEFSFSDVYAPIDFGALRFCEARVWSFFKDVNDEMQQYYDYALGKNQTNRMPLYLKPNRKLSVGDLQHFMRDHYTGTELDLRNDIGAGPFKLPYRWRPLTWKADGKTYFHERSNATQQTGFSYVAQSRSWLPGHIGGIFWFGVDDANSTVYIPMYCGMTKVPETFAEGNGDMLSYSETSAFWVFNRVANYIYLRYDLMIEDVRNVQRQFENRFMAYTPAIDDAALVLYKKDQSLAREFITDYSVNAGNEVVKRWKELSNFLLVKYMDGNVKQEKDGEFLRNPYGYPLPPRHPGYPEWWLRKIVEETGDRFEYLNY